MNRNSSNPFLSDWDDVSQPENITAALQQARSMIPGAAVGVQQTEQQQQQQQQSHQNNGPTNQTSQVQARRSSCSQAEFGSSATRQADQTTRQGLFRRNMSSFEAASLQLEHQQQRMLENGSKLEDLNHLDLIAKMTADFQSAIQTNEAKLDFVDINGVPLDFNPFDPFETIVDDDVALPAGNSNNINSTTTNQSKQQQHKHDSIDDDEDELVSTPVRNIKSNVSPDQGLDSANNNNNNTNAATNETISMMLPTTSMNNVNDGDGNEPSTHSFLGKPDSRTKASLFASLLAEAENDAPSASGLNTMANSDDLTAAAAAATTTTTTNFAGNVVDNYANDATSEMMNHAHVIRGSPNSANGDPIERPVGFFDPFETVVDKDALSELMQQQQTTKNITTSSDNNSTGCDDSTTNRLNLSTHRYMIGVQSTTESASIETVIENTPTGGALAVVSPSNDDVDDNMPSSSTAAADDKSPSSLADNNNNNDEETTTTTEKSTTESGRAGGYDSSYALSRPMGRQLDGLTAPQPTPMRRPAKSQSHKGTSSSKQKSSNQNELDSSSSDDEDERIQIVIRAKVDQINTGGETAATATGEQTAPSLVPLLPPPPSKNSMKQARERGQVEDMPSPIMSYKSRRQQRQGSSSSSSDSSMGDGANVKCDDITRGKAANKKELDHNNNDINDHEGEQNDDRNGKNDLDNDDDDDDDDDDNDNDGQFVIQMNKSDFEDEDGDNYGKSDTPLYDDDTSYVLEEFPAKYDGPGWEMMLRYPPKKRITTNRFWKRIFVKLVQVPVAVDAKTKQQQQQQQADSGQGAQDQQAGQTCWALQIYDKQEDKRAMQEIPIQATYTVSEIGSQMFDQFGKIFTLKLQYIFYKERVGVRQGQLARFIHTGHIGTSTTSGGHGVDPISIGAIKRMGAPIEHSPQISYIIKLGCANYEHIKQLKESLEDCLFRMPIHRDRALSTYKTEEVQMAVRDETYIEVNQIGTITRQMARVRLFFLSFLNGTPIVEVGINDIHRQGREVVGRMDILPVVTEEWIRLEACELHSTVDQETFDDVQSRLVKLTPPDATFFELMRFRVRPPRNRELPLQISANMSVTRTKVSYNCEVMIPGCVSRKHGQIPCENIAIRIHIPECWIYFFREEKHFRMGSKKSVNRRPGKVKGIERLLGGGGGLQDIDDESSLIEVTSGQAKYEHHHHSIVWRATRWPKDSQNAYVQNTMKIRLPLTAYDKMPENFNEYVYVEYTMPATTVSHTTLRSIAVQPCDDEAPEKYVKYSSKYEYKVKMRLSVNIGASGQQQDPRQQESSPIIIMKQQQQQKHQQQHEVHDDIQKEEDIDDDVDSDDDDD